jgi:hypothetical protein
MHQYMSKCTRSNHCTSREECIIPVVEFQIPCDETHTWQAEQERTTTTAKQPLSFIISFLLTSSSTSSLESPLEANIYDNHSPHVLQGHLIVKHTTKKVGGICSRRGIDSLLFWLGPGREAHLLFFKSYLVLQPAVFLYG